MCLIITAMLSALGLPSACANAAGPIGTPGPLVRVGPGVAEASIRQVVRTPAGRVYIVAADNHGDFSDGSDSNAANGKLYMYRANQVGVPTSFAEVDAAHRPANAADGSTISGGDARLDRAGTIHLVYFRTANHAVIYQTFSTITDRWGAPETVDTLAGETEGRRGKALTALALDAAGHPLIAVAGSTGVQAYTRTGAGAWSAHVIDGSPSTHPSLLVDRTGVAQLAWLSPPAGTAHIAYATRSAAGAWSAPATAASGDVLDDQALDQGPSLAVDAADRPVVLFLSGGANPTSGPNDYVRTRTLVGGTWQEDSPNHVAAHTPGLYMHGNDKIVLLGHDEPAIHPAYLSHAAGAGAWSDSVTFAPPTPGNYEYDGSASPRFDPLYDTDCTLLDTAFFDEDSVPGQSYVPTLYYAAVRLPAPAGGCAMSGGGSGGGGGGGGGAGAPALSRVKLTHRRFSARAGARLKFTLSSAATVTGTVRASLAGHRKGKKCSVAKKTGGRCHLKVRRSLKLKNKDVGAHSAKLATRGLLPGSYTLRLKATNAAGVSAPVTLHFVVTKPHRN